MNAEYVCIAVPLIELDTSLIHTEYLPMLMVMLVLWGILAVGEQIAGLLW